MIVEWKPSFCCGVESIDEQHKALVGLIATLQRAMAEARVKEEVGEIVENLVFYTRYHFAWEEQWLDQHGFKGLAAHMAEHERLTHEVLQLQGRLQEGKLIAGMPLMRLLQDWLLSHIDQRDKTAVASVLREQKAAELQSSPRALEKVAD
ncbi:MAG: bacteriohemerythrin [Bryobacteraceae bacterium]|jgi:hemerythrin-like metal-binding protein